MQRKPRILSTILFSLSAPVFADDVANENNSTTLEDIQVVATKNKPLPKSYQNQSPQNESATFVPAVTVAAPEDTAHTTAQELNNMAGISIVGGTQTVTQNISIGGLARDNIVVGIDGVNNYFTNFGGNDTRLLPSPYLFKQVSATQTGSDITIGSGNVGGAVNFTTIDPEDLLHGDKLSTQATLGGNSATEGVNSNAALAARSGRVAYLIDLVGTNDNNMQLGNGTTLPYSANTNFQGLAKITVDISNSQSLKLSFLNMQNHGQYPATIVNSTNATNQPANFDFNQSQTTLDYRYKPNNPYVDIKVQASYQTSNYALNPIYTNSGLNQAPQNITLNTSSIKVNNTTLVAEQKLLYGIEATNISGSDMYSSPTVLNFPTSQQQLYGIYLQDSWDITKKINVTAGTRYNNYQNQSANDGNSGGGLFTSQVGLNYQFLPGWLAYVGYSEGFQAPTLSNLYMSGYHEYSPGNGYIYQANPELKPEIAHNTSAGIKYKTNINDEQSFMLSANAFLNNVSNYVLWTYVGQSGSTNVTQMGNVTQAQLYGYSLAINYTSPWVILDTNFTSTYGSTQSSYYNGSNNLIPAGSALPIPQAKGYVGLGFPIKPIDSLIQTSLNYTLTQTRTPATVYGTLPDAPGYAIVGLAYSWKPKQSLKGIEAMLGVDNIFNQNYQNYNGYTLFPALGRNIYAQASYKY